MVTLPTTCLTVIVDDDALLLISASDELTQIGVLRGEQSPPPFIDQMHPCLPEIGENGRKLTTCTIIIALLVGHTVRACALCM